MAGLTQWQRLNRLVLRDRIGYTHGMKALNRARAVLERRAGPWLGLLALVVYVVTLSAGAFPGHSARFVAEAASLSPRLTPAYPLWFAAASLLQRLPGSVSLTLNLLNALLGALTVMLLHGVIHTAVLRTVAVNAQNRARAETAAGLAALGTALFLAFSLPFWYSATHAHPVMLSLLLLAVLARLLLDYASSGSAWRLLLFGFLYGLAVVESASFIVFAPVAGLGLIFAMWRREHLRIGPLLGVAVTAVLGLLLYLLAAWRFQGTEGYVIREYDGLYQVLFYTWRDQWFAIKRSLPPVGWLLVVAVSIVPWLTSLAVARRGLNEERDWGYYLLHAVLVGITLGVLLNLPFAPWALLGPNRLLVMPYMLCATVFGYLCAYVFLLPGGWWPNTESAGLRRVRAVTGPVLAALLLVAAVAAPFRNAREADGRAARFVNVFAREVIDSLDGRTWLVTDGSIDNHIRLAAAEQDIHLTLLNLRKEGNQSYMRWVASLFPDNARLRNTSEVSLFSLLQEWIPSDPEIGEKLALMIFPDLWLGADYAYLPVNTVFLGLPTLTGLDVTALVSRHERFCNAILPLMHQAEAPEDAGSVRHILGLYRDHLARHLSLVANNLGVALEDIARPEEAFAAYERARRFDPENISVLLNQSAMLRRGHRTERADAIEAELQRLIEDESRRYQIWALARYYGFVRSPEAFLRMGLAWARSGRPGLAVSGLRRAIEFLPNENRGAVKQMLADIYFLQDEDEAGETLYYELLVEDPENVRALLGSARIASRNGDFQKARAFLERAEAAGAPKTVMAIEWASAHAMAGQTDEARIILQDLIEIEPRSVRAWAMLAGILAEADDAPGLRRCIDTLEGLDAPTGLSDVMRGRLAELEGDPNLARERYENALRSRPLNRRVLEALLRLDLLQGRQSEARDHARKLLRLDPDNAFANYVMGTVHIAENNFDLAEASLRRSLEGKMTPAAFNDLAWVVLERGQTDKAEKFARAALKMAPEMYQAWDTLGMALLRSGRLDEANDAIEKAVSLSADDPSVILHLAELRALQNDAVRARELLDALDARRQDLSEWQKSSLERVRELIGR
jgi:tetratricopeptide (TPR) repeat protein/4-amino-4-deoxy-L-arabinose transferase-like glycosyltransferase